MLGWYSSSSVATVKPRNGQSLEDLLTLDPRQGRAQAVVHAISEGHVGVRLPRDVELVGVGEHVGIPIGRGDEPADAIVLAHHLVAHLEILGGEPLDRLDRRVIAQALLGRPLGDELVALLVPDVFVET
jgi:hypothetical protein